MRVKICGITTVQDAAAAVRAGADAIGLNFVGGPRQINLDRAREILECCAPLVTPVALVRPQAGQLPDPLVELLGEFWVCHLQVYGGLSSGELAMLAAGGFRPMPVLAVRDACFAAQADPWLGGAPGGRASGRPHAIVLDAFDAARQGGTGRAFCWDWVKAACEAGELDNWPPIILAGGLTPDNVAQAIQVARPFGVDVSSGVELDNAPGRKDESKMRAFVRNARDSWHA